MQQEYTNKSGVGVTFVGVFLLYANITTALIITSVLYYCIMLLPGGAGAPPGRLH